MMSRYHSPTTCSYQICVQGRLDARWSDWFDGLTVQIHSQEPSFAVVTARVADQAALRGILNSLMDMNLKLISVLAIDAAPEQKTGS